IIFGMPDESFQRSLRVREGIPRQIIGQPAPRTLPTVIRIVIRITAALDWDSKRIKSLRGKEKVSEVGKIELRNHTGFKASPVEVWKIKLLQVFEPAFGAKYLKQPCWRGVPSVVLEPFEFREPFELLDKVVTRAKRLEWKEIKPRSVNRFGTHGINRFN